MKRFLTALLAVSSLVAAASGPVLFAPGQPMSLYIPDKPAKVVAKASEMLQADITEVSGIPVMETDWHNANVRVCDLSSASPSVVASLEGARVPVDSLSAHRESFALKADGDILYAVGADPRGTAYAMLEISRLAGVSPWIWWNDSEPEHLESLELPRDFSLFSAPGVDYRGIFINDEDWSLQPWSWQTFEPGSKPGTIGAATYRELFKLLLRLRGNTLWPAMHPDTTPFFMTPGAVEAADSFGIVLGSSHCEPMLRNNTGEWDTTLRGPYNYITNRAAVLQYWEERVKETAGRDALYTIGMRGIHDGPMEGVKTMEEKVPAMRSVIADQRAMLQRILKRDASTVPQVFMPYKEVLDLLDNGLEIPVDVTLMWCDDNYGYMTRLEEPSSKPRAGRGGVYYHLSYWGRPHDYLWLGTTQPGLIWNEMNKACAHGADRIWIANIHDPKTAAYQLELFLDLAWHGNAGEAAGADAHLGEWLAREFGSDAAAPLTEVFKEYYRLTAVRRPEHMGWSQVELSDRKAYPRGRSHAADTEFSFTAPGNEAQAYMDSYLKLVKEVDSIKTMLPKRCGDAYFASVEYPVKAAAAMAVKMLEAQRARQLAAGQSGKGLWNRDARMLQACARSQDAYQRIRSLTAFYNDSVAQGKWKGLVRMNPRDLNVFNPPILPVGLTDSEVKGILATDSPMQAAVVKPRKWGLNAIDYTSATYSPEPVAMLGHSQKAVPLPCGERLEYETATEAGPHSVTVALIPTHPSDGRELRIKISVDGDEPTVHSIKEQGRTERWKLNVLRNQALAIRKTELAQGRHTVCIEALDPNIVVDQLAVEPEGTPPHYTLVDAPAGN